jgi:hypothetical protein
MHSLGAPDRAVALQALVVLAKIGVSYAFWRDLRYARRVFLVAFLSFSVLDLSFLFIYGWASIFVVPSWSIRFATVFAFSLGVASLATTSRVSSHEHAV